MTSCGSLSWGCLCLWRLILRFLLSHFVLAWIELAVHHGVMQCGISQATHTHSVKINPIWVLIFKGAQTATWALAEQKLGKVWWWSKVFGVIELRLLALLIYKVVLVLLPTCCTGYTWFDILCYLIRRIDGWFAAYREFLFLLIRLCWQVLSFRVDLLSGWGFLSGSLWLTQKFCSILCLVLILYVCVGYAISFDRVWAHWAARLGAFLPNLRLTVLPIVVWVTQGFDHFLDFRVSEPIEIRIRKAFKRIVSFVWVHI